MKTKIPSSVWSTLQVLGAGSLLAFSVASQASTLSWYNPPILGSHVDDTGSGQLTVTVNGSTVVVPSSSTLPSQSVFVINPTEWDGTHFYDPSVIAFAASAVHIALDSEYTYTGRWAFLGNGANAPYAIADYPSGSWSGSWGFNVAELYSSIGDFWLEDVGNWQYTETWTGFGGSDEGANITSTRDFTVALVQASVPVPEPASLALVGLALFGVAASRRRARR